MSEKTNVVLNAVLPMSNVMFAMLVSEFAKTGENCCSCSYSHEECVEFAKQGKCKAMVEFINEILVFHTGEMEFATTRHKLTKMLEVLHREEHDCWIPETVDDVIEAYINYGDFREKNAFAISLLENLENEVFDSVVCEFNWKDRESVGGE